MMIIPSKLIYLCLHIFKIRNKLLIYWKIMAFKLVLWIMIVRICFILLLFIEGRKLLLMVLKRRLIMICKMFLAILLYTMLAELGRNNLYRCCLLEMQKKYKIKITFIPFTWLYNHLAFQLYNSWKVHKSIKRWSLAKISYVPSYPQCCKGRFLLDNERSIEKRSYFDKHQRQ